MTRNGFDELDKLPNDCHVTYFSFGALLYSIIFHIIDVGYDFYISFFEYLIKEKYTYFWSTVVIIMVSSIVITLFSIRMYVDDSKHSKMSGFIKLKIVLSAVGVFFQLAPLIRLIDSFRYAIKSLKAEYRHDRNEQNINFKKMIHEDSDLVLLKVFECYSESAPQLVLQISIMLIEYSYDSHDHFVRQVIMIILNFLSMGVCMANYHRSIRFDQNDKKNISNVGLLAQFLWHSHITVSRILALSALMSINPLWSVFIVVHWCGMTIWLAVKVKTNFCGKSLISEVLFSGAVGLVYIFNFISFKEGPTRNSYLVFYSVCFIENIIMSAIWGFYSYLSVESWVYLFFLIIPTCTFLLGIIFMVIYYKFLHPTKFNEKAIVETD